ncbi:transposase [Streptomyces sp. NEAU-sy36]|uniref:transposase n=1 Tax=Streptomyces sp. NEAU-sy36 TaxID=2751189 RepID=UPI00214AEDC5|nr:transposase [Streptomyces sp. NEAU-sy36]
MCKVTTELPEQPARRQRQHGRVGVDLGVKHLAALSQPLQPGTPATAFVPNPRHARKTEHRLTKAQRALARAQKGSTRRDKAAPRGPAAPRGRRGAQHRPARPDQATHHPLRRSRHRGHQRRRHDPHRPRHPRQARPTRPAESRTEPGHSRYRARRAATPAHRQDPLARLHPRGPRPVVAVQQDLLRRRGRKSHTSRSRTGRSTAPTAPSRSTGTEPTAQAGHNHSPITAIRAVASKRMASLSNRVATGGAMLTATRANRARERQRRGLSTTVPTERTATASTTPLRTRCS